MKLLPITAIITMVSAGRLENTYLPPSSARFSGGSGGILATPLSTLGGPRSSLNQESFTNPSPFGRVSESPSAGIRPYSGPSTAPVPILRLINDNNGVGGYRYDYETANHIAVEESGHLKNADTTEVQGSFSYQAPDGQTISVKYIADENGFRPVGDHLPTQRPVPVPILKSLEINAAGQASGGYHPSSGLAASGKFGSVGNQYLPPGGRQGGY